MPGGFSQGVPIFNIKRRRVESGQIRLRDRQTLILTGIIQEDDIAEAQKWPILGDLPLIGSLFRASRRTREKRELVVLVTPSIIDDEDKKQEALDKIIKKYGSMSKMFIRGSNENRAIIKIQEKE